jgi:hypothetical protein
MEVHPPHHPLHTWRDFFIHLFTITVGLLIALGLEAAAEAVHHRHIVHQAEANLHAELRENRDLLAKDERQLEAARNEFANNLRILSAVRDHAPMQQEPGFRWYWSGTQDAAWNAARDTGALALMPYEKAQGYSIVYGQQQIVGHQAEAYIADIYRFSSPLQGGRKLPDLQPAELDAMIANAQQTLADMAHLRDLCNGLDNIYAHADSRL